LDRLPASGTAASPSEGAEPEATTADLAASLLVDRPIVLVGMPGVGKTTVGRRLAKLLGLSFHDADNEIEAACGGRSVSEIFAEWGEPEFRRVERQVIARLVREGPPIVLATGGGAFVDPETRALLRDRSVTVWLRADLEILLSRVLKKREKRPLLMQDPRGALERLFAARAPIYAQADIAIESARESQSQTLSALLRALHTQFKSRSPQTGCTQS
jgi:shikimate kinase